MAMTNERIGGKESLLKVAAIQIEPQIGDLKGNREKLIHKVNNAFNQGWDLSTDEGYEKYLEYCILYC